ncbi:MAG: Gx transporter family protein [Oscillospiraceae bacterium]|nr:Gx transporter family protein [Oscillospiraceae bacterium]
MRMKTKKVTVMAMCIALAMILSYLESLIPSPGIPGVKLGLANLAVIFALYKLGWKEAVGVSLLRVLLVSLLFGHAASLMYSAAGAVLSLLGMILLRRFDKLSCVFVSVSGGVLHNVGQILMAWVLMGSNVVFYLPVLILSGTVAGVVIGVVAALLVKRTDIGERKQF